MTRVEDIPENELGVERDRLIDAKMEASNAVQRLERLYVDLDTLADSKELPSQFVEEIREAQDNAKTALNRAKSLRQAYNYRLERVESRLYD